MKCLKMIEHGNVQCSNPIHIREFNASVNTTCAPWFTKVTSTNNFRRARRRREAKAVGGQSERGDEVREKMKRDFAEPWTPGSESISLRPPQNVFFSFYTMYKPYIPGHWGTSWYNMVLTHLLAEMQPYWSWPINPVDAKKMGDHGWIMGRNYRTSCEFLMFLMGASCSNTWSSLRLTHAMLACPRYLLSLKSPNMGYPKRRNWWYALDFRGYKLPFFFWHGFPLTKEQRAKEKEAKMAKEWGLPKALQWRPLVAFLYGNPEKRCRKSQIQYLK